MRIASSLAFIALFAVLTAGLWYCFDDHLAVAFGTPGLGHLPWWVPVLGRVFLGAASHSSRKD